MWRCCSGLWNFTFSLHQFFPPFFLFLVFRKEPKLDQVLVHTLEINAILCTWDCLLRASAGLVIMSLLFKSHVLACISATKTKDEREWTSQGQSYWASGSEFSFSCGFTVFKKESGYWLTFRFPKRGPVLQKPKNVFQGLRSFTVPKGDIRSP